MKYTKNIIPVAFLAISITSFTSCDKISGIFDGATPTEYTTEAEYANTESKEGATESLSKAKEDFPDPDTPVKTISLRRGSSKSTLCRLFSLAPRIIILSSDMMM